MLVKKSEKFEFNLINVGYHLKIVKSGEWNQLRTPELVLNE